MKILMVNKFLFPNGGSETYMLSLGDYLEEKGHEVQYFGMEHEGRCVGNKSDAYTQDMDFHTGSKLVKLTYPFKIIYSSGARKKIRQVLKDFKPDVIHLNNFNFQLTPSIILEIQKWKKEGNICKIIYTAHDYQLVCPNHMCNNPNTFQNCEKCVNDSFFNCTKNKCIHGSFMKSFIGTVEAIFWKMKGTYKYIDTIICCSDFMKKMLDRNSVFASKTIVMQNFNNIVQKKETIKKDYVLYFGRYSKEKGIFTLIQACKELPEIDFVFAGKGPYSDSLKNISNIKDVGFQKGEELEKLIREAQFTVCPSEWYENCPFSVIESQMYATPVLGADIGGIPELIDNGRTGELFISGDKDDLKEHIYNLWNDRDRLKEYSNNCKVKKFDTIDDYYKKIIDIYQI